MVLRPCSSYSKKKPNQYVEFSQEEAQLAKSEAHDCLLVLDQCLDALAPVEKQKSYAITASMVLDAVDAAEALCKKLQRLYISAECHTPASPLLLLEGPDCWVGPL